MVFGFDVNIYFLSLQPVQYNISSNSWIAIYHTADKKKKRGQGAEIYLIKIYLENMVDWHVKNCLLIR